MNVRAVGIARALTDDVVAPGSDAPLGAVTADSVSLPGIGDVQAAVEGKRWPAPVLVVGVGGGLSSDVGCGSVLLVWT